MKYLKYTVCLFLVFIFVSCSFVNESEKDKNVGGSISDDVKSVSQDTDTDFPVRSDSFDVTEDIQTTFSESSFDPGEAYNYTSKGYKIENVDGITYVNGILIANKTYPLPETYSPGGLIYECEQAFYKMQSAAQADGLRLFVKSGYRSFIDQKIIYNGYVQSDSQENADRYSARPGHSEHQSGLALDINSTSISFADTAEGKWLEENSYKYGFILRYPKEKESITGYMYEPWHVRYLGEELAQSVHDSGLCLEEYLGITSVYS